jgi:4-aminobutyrate aminotransferase
MSGLCARDTVSITVLQKLRFFLQAMVGGKGALLRADEGCVLIDLSAA